MKGLLSDLANQIWTFVGLFSAWLVLTGSAKTVVGYATLISIDRKSTRLNSSHT